MQQVTLFNSKQVYDYMRYKRTKFEFDNDTLLNKSDILWDLLSNRYIQTYIKTTADLMLACIKSNKRKYVELTDTFNQYSDPVFIFSDIELKMEDYLIQIDNWGSKINEKSIEMENYKLKYEKLIKDSKENIKSEGKFFSNTSELMKENIRLKEKYNEMYINYEKIKKYDMSFRNMKLENEQMKKKIMDQTMFKINSNIINEKKRRRICL